MKLTISHDEAQNLHQQYYEKNFVVTNFTRSGQCDVFPWSWVYGISDIGSWEGNISTDGEKFVVTKSGYVSADKVKETYQFNRDDITDISVGIFYTKIFFNKKIPGLTKRHWLSSYILILSAFILFPIFFLFPRKRFEFKIQNEYKTKELFEDILKNPDKVIEDEQEENDAIDNTSKADQKNDSSNANEETDLEIKLKEIDDLKEKGLLTEEEYLDKRKNILDL